MPAAGSAPSGGKAGTVAPEPPCVGEDIYRQVADLTANDCLLPSPISSELVTFIFVI